MIVYLRKYPVSFWFITPTYLDLSTIYKKSGTRHTKVQQPPRLFQQISLKMTMSLICKHINISQLYPLSLQVL